MVPEGEGGSGEAGGETTGGLGYSGKSMRGQGGSGKKVAMPARRFILVLSN